MAHKVRILAGVVAAATMALSASASAAQGYYRFPSLHQDTLVFTAEGDLWKTQLGSQMSQRLTTHPAEERQAHISPDGEWVAYVANYEGASEVYRMPLSGGVPERLTFESSRVRLQGFDAQGQLLYSTDNANGPSNYWVLRRVDPQTKVTQDLPLADANQGSISADGRYLVFTRFGLQTTGDNAKLYRGGAMGQLWRYQIGTDQEAVQLLPQHQGSLSHPMLHQDRIYFLSDASGSANIWSMSIEGTDLTQHTDFEDWQVRAPQLDNNKIVFQLGADIHLLDLANSKSAPVAIELASDFGERQQRWVEKPMKYASLFSLSGDGKSVAVTSRGKVALVKQDKSRLVELATPANSRSRNTQVSPDGRYVYVINDAAGENEIWRYAADGSEQARQLTKDANTFRWNLSLSPDGRYLAHDDKAGNLFLMDTKNFKNRKILENANGNSPLQDLSWSSDSRFLAYTRTMKGEDRPAVALYDVEENETQVLTSQKYESFAPTFSQDGHWLYLLSNRTFVATPGSPWGDRNMGPVFDNRTQIYAFGLTKDAPYPFQKPNELLKTPEDDAEYDLDWDGIKQRLWPVPVAAGNYSQLQAGKDGLYMLKRGLNPAQAPEIAYLKYDAQKPAVATFAKDARSFEVSNDAEQIFWRSHSNGGEKLFIAAAGEKAPDDLSQAQLDTKPWQMMLEPKQEWNAMFHDAWIQHRDSLFDPTMRGLDWAATKTKYQPLLERLTDRHELNDLFAQMMGELNALHSQVRGGDFDKLANPAKSALLGARLANASQGVRIERIYRTDPEVPEMSGPLAAAGVNAQDGDVIVAVNGRKVKDLGELTAALRNQAKQQVKLTLKRSSRTIDTIVTPVSAGQHNKLKYQDWVYSNVDKVNAQDSRIGYLHLYSMVSSDIASFAREFYANLDKQGLIIDVRRNRGGNIDSWVIEKLMRKAWAFWQNPGDKAYTNMQQAYRGHLVVLTDQLTYSDGETFSAGIKALGVAPLIGQRTAGAGVWLSGRNRLTDGGMARVAEFTQYAIDGRWIVEGHGVEPDVYVDNLPLATFNGSDAQLAKAIEYLQGQINQSPVPVLQGEPLPDVNTPAKDITP
ncbi:S41 family peptidase [Paraferrimonas sedimenticola]|uniref:Tricorn protease homolog n=1 Tax=Paraferrimonas sedimenticola TaxID=375674 RepID=A0AA37S0G0_9GAMM|nr:S41 family peptidase [Paraferrimonas sedimenticola]GLP98133.1 tricorn protease [Paraferrimonas sedimenticola]